MQQFLRYTAWEMEKPKPFGLFHVLMLLVGISVCIGIAYRLRHVTKNSMFMASLESVLYCSY